MFRDILRKVCVQELGYEVVGETGDGAEAVVLATRTTPDLVLLDLHLPTLDGFSVLDELRVRTPRTRILVLSSHCDDFTVYRAERAYVNGFVDKNTNSVETLKVALAALAAGKVWFSEAFLASKAARRQNPRSFDKLLTDRERAVLALVGQPLADTEIAVRLGISEKTVEKHRFNILHKLGLGSTTELVRYARDNGFTLMAPPGGGGLLP